MQQDGSANTNHLTDLNADFVWDVDLNEKEFKDKLLKSDNEITIMSKAFKSGRRLYHLKLDISLKTN